MFEQDGSIGMLTELNDVSRVKMMTLDEKGEDLLPKQQKGKHCLS